MKHLTIAIQYVRVNKGFHQTFPLCRSYPKYLEIKIVHSKNLFGTNRGNFYFHTAEINCNDYHITGFTPQSLNKAQRN